MSFNIEMLLSTGRVRFIGSHIVSILSKKNFEKIRILDNFGSGYLSNTKYLKINQRIDSGMVNY